MLKQQKKRRGLFWAIVIAVLILVGLFVWYTNQSTAKVISRAEFDIILEDNKVEYVYGLSGVFYVKEYKDGDTLDEENFQKFIDAKTKQTMFSQFQLHLKFKMLLKK